MKKGRRDRHSSFVALDRKVLFSCPEFRQLSPRAVTLYLYLKAKYNGANNGQIRFHYSELQGVNGFGSPSTVSATFRELEKAGWVKRNRVGGLYRFQNEYELTGRFDERV
jgi:hypothetical protein